MNGFPSNSPEPQPVPRWETAAMIVSFALVWAYFLAFQSARRNGLAPHFGWNLALMAALGVLVWVFVRRLKRILAAIGAHDKRNQ